MAKGKAYDNSGDRPWNVADSYSRIKIMKPLNEIDEYIKIARTGVSELDQEFVVNNQTKINARILALRRFHMTLEMLINNSRFGVAQKDKELFDQWIKALKNINLDQAYTTATNKEGFKREVINEVVFEIVLNTLVNIHKDILEPLNKAGMIFPKGEEEWEPDWGLDG